MNVYIRIYLFSIIFVIRVSTIVMDRGRRPFAVLEVGLQDLVQVYPRRDNNDFTAWVERLMVSAISA